MIVTIRYGMVQFSFQARLSGLNLHSCAGMKKMQVSSRRTYAATTFFAKLLRDVACLGRSSGFRLWPSVRAFPSREGQWHVCGVRNRLQQRDCDGFSPYFPEPVYICVCAPSFRLLVVSSICCSMDSVNEKLHGSEIIRKVLILGGLRAWSI